MEYIVKNLNLVNLQKYIDIKFRKKKGGHINMSDVQGYVRRGKLPDYMGDVEIEENKEITSTRLYHLKKS